jgi:hypothetical protein
LGTARRYVVGVVVTGLLPLMGPSRRRPPAPAECLHLRVHPAGSGNGSYRADWFEVTNTGTSPVDTGWTMDDDRTRPTGHEG